MTGPTNNQRSLLANIVGRDSISKASFAFLSGDLSGIEPEVYRQEFLDDLVLLEAADEANDPLERFGVPSVLRVLRAFGGCKLVSPCSFSVALLIYRSHGYDFFFLSGSFSALKYQIA